jgi:hypothetical protein
VSVLHSSGIRYGRMSSCFERCDRPSSSIKSGALAGGRTVRAEVRDIISCIHKVYLLATTAQ